MSWNTIRRARAARRWSRLAAVAATSALGAGVLAGPALAQSSNFNFRTLNNDHDVTFNQLLGINNSGLIAGYFGSGMTGHPNKGYLLSPGYGQRNYRNENFPTSAQTQVTGLNNDGVTVGFWADAAGDNFGFYSMHGKFHKANFPTSNKANPSVDQLLGVNDSGVAVGFYNDKNGNSHGYEYNIARHSYHKINIGGASSVTATAINNWGDVAGFETNSAGNTVAFLKQSHGRTLTLSYPGAAMTQAFGVNDGDEVVGAYTDGTGSSATTHGFIWAPGFGFQTVDDPNGVGTTTINGVNDRGQLVGFYTDSAGNTDGLLATPAG